LAPFTPATTHRILEMIGQGEEAVTWLGEKPWHLPAGASIAKPIPLFEKLTEDKLKAIRAGASSAY
ncbi:MAG: hypothetical protein QXF89_08285, partial [Candidatus Caldarchaeum sp.]